MSKSQTLVNSAIAGIVALGVSGLAFAAGPAPKPDYKFEQCHGVAKAGMNDCQTATHSCAGTSTKNGAADDWVYMPVGLCEKIVGGKVSSM